MFCNLVHVINTCLNWIESFSFRHEPHLTVWWLKNLQNVLRSQSYAGEIWEHCRAWESLDFKLSRHILIQVPRIGLQQYWTSLIYKPCRPQKHYWNSFKTKKYCSVSSFLMDKKLLHKARNMLASIPRYLWTSVQCH